MSEPAASRDMRSFFDHYVLHDFPRRRSPDGKAWIWPGDEWVNDEVRENTYATLLQPADGQHWQRVVEIGPGSGKYTEMLLERTDADVIAFELSSALLASLNERCAGFVASGRLDARPIDWTTNDGLVHAVSDWERTVDLYVGIDVFLMMDFQSVFVHLVSAASVLRVGGRFAATFGDADSESGWDRLVRDAGRHSAFSQDADTRFHWFSCTQLERTFERLGFRIVTNLSGPIDGDHSPLDIARRYIVAELVDAEPAAVFRRALAGNV